MLRGASAAWGQEASPWVCGPRTYTFSPAPLNGAKVNMLAPFHNLLPIPQHWQERQ